MSAGLTKAVWLHLLREGGRWATADVLKALSAGDEKGVATVAKNLAVSGSLRRFDKQGKGIPGDRVTYGVTKACTVPKGVTLEELMCIGIVKEAA